MPTSSRIELAPQAAADIEHIAEYLRQEAGLAVALRFVKNTHGAFLLLVDVPRVGALLAFISVKGIEVRRWQIEGFGSYLILYRVAAQGVHILRVLHGARDIEALF